MSLCCHSWWGQLRSLSQGPGTPLCWGMWLPSPIDAYILPIAFETEQEDEMKAPEEGKVGMEEGQVFAISVLIPVSQGTGPTGVFSLEFIGC